MGVQGLRLNPEAKQQLQAYHWPGNVRELEHLLSRAALKAIAEQGRDVRTVTVSAAHLDLGLTESRESPQAEPQDSTPEPLAFKTELKQSLKESVDNFQRELISQALISNGGNQAATARQLGMNRSNFYRLLQRLELR